jgi:hypothetical protein
MLLKKQYTLSKTAQSPSVVSAAGRTALSFATFLLPVPIFIGGKQKKSRDVKPVTR